MKKILFIVLLFVSGVQAQITIRGHTYADTVHITQANIDQTFTTNDRAYVLQENVSCTLGTAIPSFVGCDTCAFISEPGQKYTITMYRNDPQRNGVTVSSCDWFNMKNIRLTVDWGRQDTFDIITRNDLLGPITFRLTNGTESWIDSCYFYTTGYIQVVDSLVDDQCAKMMAYGISDSLAMLHNITNCSLIVDYTGWRRRDKYPALGIDCVPSGVGTRGVLTGSRSDYTLRLAHNYIENSCFAARFSSKNGSGVWVYDSNTVRNMYKNTSDEPYGGSLFGDGGAFAYTGGNKIFARGNTITDSVDLGATPPIYGGNGIYLGIGRNPPANGMPGTLPASPKSEIKHNYMRARLEDSHDHTHNIFNKFGALTIDIDSNTFISTITTNSYTYGSNIWMWMLDSTNIRDNEFTIVTESDSYTGINIIIRNHDSATTNTSTSNGAYSLWENNTLYSNDYFFRFYNDNGEGCCDGDINNLDWKGFSLNRIDSVSTMSGTIFDHIDNGGAVNDIGDVAIIDMHTDANLTDTTAVEWGSSANTDYLDWYRNLVITVEDEYSNNLTGDVVITDGNGTEIYNASVVGLDTLLTHYWHNTAGTADSSYNPFIGTAIYNTDTLVDTFYVGETNNTVTFTFSGGTPPTTRNQFGRIILGR